MAQAAEANQPPLDDLMMAMDVVDTLRHREAMVERELSADQRKQQMIARLHEIYASQGLEVTDRILEQGVEALEQERFVYKPKRGGFAITLANLYIRRGQIARWLGIGLAVLIAIVAAYMFLIQQPAQRAAERLQIELTETIPADLERLQGAIAEEANDPAVAAAAATVAADGVEAAELQNAEEARQAVADLESTLQELRLSYEVVVVSRPGEQSGVFRIPDDVPNGRNYYLIVEAIDEDGNVLRRTITSEEDDATRTVTMWGVRVPQSVYDRVAADKTDDGIIQNDVIGEKERGDLEISWTVETLGGAILDW